MGSPEQKRVIYVENDPALRGIISKALRQSPEILEVFDYATGEEAKEHDGIKQLDVALIDLSLGFGLMDGLAIGIELRRHNEFLGVVIYSQHPFETVQELVDFEKLENWSYVPKQATLNIQSLIEVLIETSQGKSIIQAEVTATVDPSRGVLDLLSPRQHLTMSMLASGYDSKYIAEKLGISVESVRQDLSRAYSILIPDPAEGTDIRISAIMKHQSLVRTQDKYAN
jgi:DNA-binding NarL/FixJ family response regulator